MRPVEVFGIVVRTFGLVLELYGLSNLVAGFASGLGTFFLVALFSCLVGSYLLRGAPLLLA